MSNCYPIFSSSYEKEVKENNKVISVNLVYKDIELYEHYGRV